MSIKNISFSLILVIAFMGAAKAQGDFVKGYIINAKGDSIRGEVKVNKKKEFDPYFKVTFKDASGAQKTYKAAKIKGYGFEGRNFIADGEQEEALFYERLTSGAIILYRSCFESVHMNQPMREYAYFLYKPGDKKMTDVKEEKFKKQIQEWMSGSAGIANDYPDDKKFNLESAIAVINKYNDWKKNN